MRIEEVNNRIRLTIRKFRGFPCIGRQNTIGAKDIGKEKFEQIHTAFRSIPVIAELFQEDISGEALDVPEIVRLRSREQEKIVLFPVGEDTLEKAGYDIAVGQQVSRVIYCK